MKAEPQVERLQLAGAVPGRASGIADKTAKYFGVIAVAYLCVLVVAEVATTFSDPRIGMGIHIALLTVLLLQASLDDNETPRGFLLALSLAPLVRILSLSLPLQDVEIQYWYAAVAVPLMIATVVVARMIGLSRRELGLVSGHLPTQLLIGSSGIALGGIEYLILSPEPLIDDFSWVAILVPALILLVGTGFMEELLFRGVIQSTARESLGGRFAIWYVATIFAVLHIGYESILDVVFVFAVAMFFGWIVLRTRSILGVTISHGITNIGLFLFFPFI